jgi:hypothetical protein
LAIFIHVIVAVAIAVHRIGAIDVLWVETRDGNGGVCIIVAGSWLGASRTRVVFTIVVWVPVVTSKGQVTTSELNRRCRTSVDASIGQEVSHTIFIVVGGWVTTACIEVTLAVVLQRRFRVVVTSEGDHATRAACELTRTVGNIGVQIKVASRVVGATLVLTRTVIEVHSAVIVGSRVIVTSSVDT